MFEMVYETLLAHELEKKGMPIQRQLLLPVEYGGLRVADATRGDQTSRERLHRRLVCTPARESPSRGLAYRLYR